MKVGTDGVLLGAWAGITHNPQTILDIGTGTGLIALQLAQRSSAHTVDAVEFEDSAYEQCVENFEASPWADRLFCYHASFQIFAEEMEEQYDLIVSNPPYFNTKAASGDPARDLARQHHMLPFTDLLQGAAHLLSPEGQFATIIPTEAEAAFTNIAQNLGLYAQAITKVRGTPTAPVKRSLLQLASSPITPIINELVLEEERHVYTAAYRTLTQDFYLKM